MKLTINLTILASVSLFFACDQQFDTADPNIGVHEAALSADRQEKPPSDEDAVDWYGLSGKSCHNGGQPAAQKCKERNDCPNVTTTDGITYKGVCGTVKKSGGKYTCECRAGKKIKKNKQKPLPAAGNARQAQSNRAVSHLTEANEAADDALAIDLLGNNGRKCNNWGKPTAQKCSLRNDCPKVTTADGITYKGACVTVKKSNGKYRCACTLGKKIKVKKSLSAFAQ